MKAFINTYVKNDMIGIIYFSFFAIIFVSLALLVPTHVISTELAYKIRITTLIIGAGVTTYRINKINAEPNKYNPQNLGFQYMFLFIVALLI